MCQFTCFSVEVEFVQTTVGTAETSAQKVTVTVLEPSHSHAFIRDTTAAAVSRIKIIQL